MNKPFTVYLDTSFYVWLCRADEVLATQTILALNNLQVRHVISEVIIRELLTSKDRSDLDELLVERAGKFKISPFCTMQSLAWDVLLLPGSERAAYADLLRDIDDKTTEATSFSIMARRKSSAEQLEKLSEAGKPILKQAGFPEDVGQDISQTLVAAKAFLEMFGIRDLDWPESPTPDDLRKLSEQIIDKLDPTLVSQIEEKNRIQDSSTVTEDRPYQVAAGSASDKTKKRLGNTLRDTEHIITFINHGDEIDLLQVDGVHEEIIKRAKPIHRLAELGLAARCFSADSLITVVDKLTKLKPSYG
jgi:hypothetical protein